MGGSDEDFVAVFKATSDASWNSAITQYAVDLGRNPAMHWKVRASCKPPADHRKYNRDIVDDGVIQEYHVQFTDGKGGILPTGSWLLMWQTTYPIRLLNDGHVPAGMPFIADVDNMQYIMQDHLGRVAAKEGVTDLTDWKVELCWHPEKLKTLG